MLFCTNVPMNACDKLASMVIGLCAHQAQVARCRNLLHSCQLAVAQPRVLCQVKIRHTFWDLEGRKVNCCENFCFKEWKICLSKILIFFFCYLSSPFLLSFFLYFIKHYLIINLFIFFFLCFFLFLLFKIDFSLSLFFLSLFLPFFLFPYNLI